MQRPIRINDLCISPPGCVGMLEKQRAAFPRARFLRLLTYENPTITADQAANNKVNTLIRMWFDYVDCLKKGGADRQFADIIALDSCFINGGRFILGRV